MRPLYRHCLLIIFLFLSANIFAQKIESKARYEINAKRAGIDYASKDALTASREFMRIDPSYYVGYMYDGTYTFNQAEDFMGYQNAIEPLQKAIRLLEKDYKKELQTRTNNLMEYFPLMIYHRDYDYLNYALYNSYSNTEQPQKAWEVIRHFLKANLQDENYMDSYNMLSWTVHRNRFYTSQKYAFLKDSISQNEDYANKLLDSSSKKIEADGIVNASFYPDFVRNKMLGVYHYKSILYTYQLNLESSNYYYNKLKETNMFPNNNYANFLQIQAKFQESQTYYDLAAQQEAGDKRLREFAYYGSINDVYKNDPKHGIHFLQKFIEANGSSTGFGWYNISLARCLLYDGQYQQAQIYLTRAEQFKEVHIGTTLGQSHYDFTINVLKLIAKEQEIASIKFQQKHWWWHPSLLWKTFVLTIEKWTIQYFLINQFANNPERDNVIYKIFSTESTVSFDEVWNVVKDFSTNFFIKKFEKELNEEKRPLVKKYFQLFLAKLYVKKGEYGIAQNLLETILKKENEINFTNEKLFMARVWETKIDIESHSNATNNAKATISRMYDTYPQIMPYTPYKIKCQLHLSGDDNKLTKSIITKIKESNIEISDQHDAYTQDVFIQFGEKEKIKTINIHVISAEKNMRVPEQIFSYTNTEDGAVQIENSIFNIGDVEKNVNVGEVKSDEK